MKKVNELTVEVSLEKTFRVPLAGIEIPYPIDQYILGLQCYVEPVAQRVVGEFLRLHIGSYCFHSIGNIKATRIL